MLKIMHEIGLVRSYATKVFWTLKQKQVLQILKL